jgi:ferric-dicitrate binding protein FerR (iron transport regulator)
MTTIQAVEAVKSDSLPDGSAVVLNKNSQVSYPSHFNGNKRAVQLNGEAFFHVKPNKQKPFVISTNDVTITVVGTSFNVRSRGDTTEIIVETGVVRVANGEQTITLTAGERTIVRRNESQLQKQAGTDQLYNYYRSKKFVCDETPLWKLVDKINEAYNVNIVIGRSELRNLPMTVTFDDEELDKILDVMRQTFEISVVKDKGQIILR